MSKVQIAIATAALVALAGCSSAPKSNEVGAAYVSSAQYASLNCDQLINEAESVRRSVPGLEAAVDKHKDSQKTVELVTWILFWPAAFALDKGAENSSQLAKAKGELEAISLAMKSKKCG